MCRRGIVYGFNVLDHDVFMAQLRGLTPPPGVEAVRVDYVGQSRQALRNRENQHREDKPWEDLIVGRPFVIEQGQWFNAELDRREVAQIHRVGPRLNHDDNLHNPHRIELPRQKWQRWERDDAQGLERWVPPEQRVAAVPVLVGSVSWWRRLVHWFRVRPNWQIKTALWSVSWVLLAWTGWLQLAAWGALAGWWRFGTAGTVAAVLVWWSVVRWSPGWKRWRRRVRRWLR